MRKAVLILALLLNLYALFSQNQFKKNKYFTKIETCWEFNFSNKVALGFDGKTFLPDSFKILIPYNVKRFVGINGSEFTFTFKSKQQILIITDLRNNKNILKDTSYIPSNEKISELLDEYYPDYNKGSYEVYKIKIYKNRVHYVLEYKDATIFMFNIKKKNFDKYLRIIKNNSF